MRFHPGEERIIQDGVEAGLVSGALQEGREPADLAGEITLEGGVVEEQEVREVPYSPPGPDVVPDRHQGIVRTIEPEAPEGADVVRRRLHERDIEGEGVELVAQGRRDSGQV